METTWGELKKTRRRSVEGKTKVMETTWGELKKTRKWSVEEGKVKVMGTT